MASIFQKFWQWLTGKTADTPAPSGGYHAVPISPEEPSSSPDPVSTTPSEATTIALARSDSSESGQAGTVGSANSLEDAEKLLPAGTYDLSLKTTGGLHSAYWFRFQDVHKGMLQIGDNSRFIRLGESGKDAQGGIVIQQIDEYLGLYTKVADDLAAGKRVQLVIS